MRASSRRAALHAIRIHCDWSTSGALAFDVAVVASQSVRQCIQITQSAVNQAQSCSFTRGIGSRRVCKFLRGKSAHQRGQLNSGHRRNDEGQPACSGCCEYNTAHLA